tara:strand:+ start:35 stop:520 length:486 start_codon:yes stop_codon:yes gene_type:complete
MNKLFTSLEEIDNTLEDYEFIKLLYSSSKRIYEQLGPGHAESTYQKALLYELNLHNLSIDIERHISVCYEDTLGNKHFITSERIDLYIHKNNSLNKTDTVLELKAVSKPIQEQEIVQVKKYIRELLKENIKINYGFVINFPQPTSKATCNEIQFMLVNLLL